MTFENNQDGSERQIRCMRPMRTESRANDWLEQGKRVGRVGRKLARFGLLGLTAHDHDLRRTFVLAGARRSGTTWVMELLSTIPRTAVLFEPFNGEHVPEARERGFDRLPYVAPGTSFEHAGFVQRALEGRVRTEFTLGRCPTHRAIGPRRWLVKLVYANPVLAWMVDEYPIPPPAFLIRHPCAVVASYLRLGDRWVAQAAPELPAPLAHERGLADYVAGLERPEERSAAHWAMGNRIALGMLSPSRVRLLSYERLYSRGPDELAPVFEAWKVPMPDAVHARFGQLSTTTMSHSYGKFARGEVLTAWRTELGNERTRRILDVVHRFGFGAFTDAPEPDHEKIVGMIGMDRGCSP